MTAIENLSNLERQKWIGRYRGLLSHSQLIQKFNNTMFVHAAAHPSLWTSNYDDLAIEQYALYGESVHIGKVFKRTYDWVDYVPKNEMVFVGHDVRHIRPYVKDGKNGGTVVFLDTGSG